jgi:hypothetical protein
VLRSLERQERQERRLGRAREALAHTPPPHYHDRDERPPLHSLPPTAAPRRNGQMELFATARRSLGLARGNGFVRQWLRFGRRGRRWELDPERAVRRVVFRLASKAMPKAIRDALWLLRGLRETRTRQR